MKTTENISLGGLAFTVEADAYAELKKYIEEISGCFRNDPCGSEIIEDIEVRISELLKERCPEGTVVSHAMIEDIKKRERIIRDFYREWKEKNPSQRKFNLSLKEYINIRMVSIVETSEHAAKSYLSTLAVLQLDSILTGARKVSVKKPKPGNANQKPFERIMIMEYELTGIGKIKMTVGVRRRTLEKVQYCITAISSE